MATFTKYNQFNKSLFPAFALILLLQNCKQKIHSRLAFDTFEKNQEKTT